MRVYLARSNQHHDNIRVLLADDERCVRSALRFLLWQETGMTVVGEAETANQVLTMTQEVHPDLVLLDWELPDLEGLTTLAQLREHHPLLGVIVLSGRPESRQAALDAGADDFVSKGDPPECLRTALADFLAHYQAVRSGLEVVGFK